MWTETLVCLLSSAQPYVAIDWDPDMKKKFYNENEAEVNVCSLHSRYVFKTQRMTLRISECWANVLD